MLLKPIKGIPDLIVRPSGVWDTRAPFSAFLQAHRQENEVYHALLLAIGSVSYDGRKRSQTASARSLFQAKDSGNVAGRSWHSYKKSFPRLPDGALYHPTVADAHNSLMKAVPAATEYAIVSHCGLFETYCQSWALNMLLALLEGGGAWRAAHRQLAHAFLPVRVRASLPTFYDILFAFPDLKAELSALPNTFVDPRDRSELLTPISPVLNALTALQFWRDWRNLLVHNSGIVNLRFAGKHTRFYREVAAMFPLRELVVGKRVSLTDAAFRAVATTGYRAARHMKELLVVASSERRGHSLAPGAARNESVGPYVDMVAKPLLLEGDHKASWRWCNDAHFRGSIRGQIGDTPTKAG